MDRHLRTGGGLQYLQRDSARLGARLLGRRLGHYRVDDLIGRGGMALVFRGSRIDRTFDRAVAIKVLPGIATSDAARARFSRERRILAALNHPGIAHLYDAGETAEGWPYFVMELVEGLLIDSYCRVHNLQPDDIARLVREVARALEFAHRRSILHRDLKPSNIIVDKRGSPRLLDFGVAKVLADDATMTAGGARMAFTPAYASPEQLIGDPVSLRSDVYQLGILLFELLSGERLFGEESVSAAVARAAGNRPPDLPAPTSVPKPLLSIVRGCLQPDPARRYADIALVIDELTRFLQRSRSLGAAPGFIAGTRRRLVRNKPAAMMAAALAASLVVNAWLLLRQAAANAG